MKKFLLMLTLLIISLVSVVAISVPMAGGCDTGSYEDPCQ